ncbi:MAG: CpXC domain-containing protein [Bacilli bacterium]|nr:CpXC domain-containing protein [Bacilli bacterium]
MATQKEDFKCPNCKKKNRIKIKREVTSKDIDKIIDRSLFKVKCLACGETVTVDYPIKVVDKDFVIYYTPCSSAEIEDEFHEYMRVCDTFDDFKEKLLIMQDSLNDVIIELTKDYLVSTLDEKIKKEIRDIRYDGNNAEHLIFYLIGANQSVGCNKEIYQKLLKKFKIKKIQKCVNIDHQTYRKYLKKRLLK